MADTEKAQERQEYLAVIEQMTLLDDELMSAFYQDDLPCADLTIQILLGKPGLQATEVTTQQTITNFKGRGVRLDIHAQAEGRDINIEIQREGDGAVPERARYNGSLMDAKQLLPGEPFTHLPDSYVIFITDGDVLNCGLPICHVERVILENGKPFGDRSHILYVNSQRTDGDTPLAHLMHDFRCADPDKMFFDTLRQRMNHFKKTPEGVSHMCKALEELTKKKTAEAEARGRLLGEAVGTAKAYLGVVRHMMATTGETAEKVMEQMGLDAAARQSVLASL